MYIIKTNSATYTGNNKAEAERTVNKVQARKERAKFLISKGYGPSRAYKMAQEEIK